MKEILSLQFGHYSNYVGTHWWNIQESGFNYTENSTSEINHDILFREGLTYKNEVTFTPRLLLVDLKGSLKSLSRYGDLYSEISDESAILWPENSIDVLADNKIPKNKFQDIIDKSETVDNSISDNLNSEVRVWSDFLYSRFHPRTVNIINEYQHENTDTTFDIYNIGKNLWNTAEFSEDFSDKIRNYIEECNSLQGFHVTVDPINGFGGLSTSCLEHIRDEYDKKSVLVFPVLPSHYSDYNFSTAEEREKSTMNDSTRLINLALSIDGLSEFCSLMVPICTGSRGWRQPGPKREFPHVDYNPKLLYHSSAILASALDTLTLPYRQKSSPLTVNDFCTDLSNRGRKIAAASLNLPFSLKAGEDLIDCLDSWEGPLWQNLTPNCEIPSDKVFQIITVRGIDAARLKRPGSEKTAKKQQRMPAYRCETVKEMLEFYLNCSMFSTASHVTVEKEPLAVKTPFPNLFDQYIDEQGGLDSIPRAGNQGVKSVPVLAGCHSSSSVGDMLETLHRDVKRIKIARFPQFTKAGLESDEYSESLDRLLSLRECYLESFE